MRNLEFNLLELMEDNNVHLRFVELDETEKKGKIQFHRSSINSNENLTEAPELVQLIAEEFRKFDLPDGRHNVPTRIRIHETDRNKILYFNASVLVESGDVIDRTVNKDYEELFCLDDPTGHPEKVQNVAQLIFTDEVKAAYVASLPRVEVENEEEHQVTVDLKVMVPNPDYDPDVEDSPKKIQATELVEEAYEASEVLDGAVLRKVPAGVRQVKQGVTKTVGVTDEQDNPVMETVKTGELTTFIEYKGKLYPEDWDGK